MNSFVNVKATFAKLPKSILWNNWESTVLNQVSCLFWRCRWVFAWDSCAVASVENVWVNLGYSMLEVFGV
jgi:hypothetical protein